MTERLDPPDLALGPLAIWIAGRASDPEYLELDVAMTTSLSKVTVSGDGLRCVDLAAFAVQLKVLYATLAPPPAVLDATDMGVVLTIRPASSVGHLVATVEMEEGRERHRFEFDFDQTILRPFLTQCRSFADLYPTTFKNIRSKLSLPRPSSLVPEITQLAGLELTIARLAANMRVFGFGPVRLARNGKGTVATFALHIQCAWKLSKDDEIITADGDLWTYTGSGEEPEDWEPADGGSLQTAQLDAVLGARRGEPKAFYYASGLMVDWAHSAPRTGYASMRLSSGHFLEIFPNRRNGEHWRLFKPQEDGPHYVFETGDIAATSTA